MRAVLSSVFVLAVAAWVGDLSGVWVGTIRSPGASAPQSGKLVLHLTQHGREITGTAGNDEAHQTPLRNGHVAGDSIEFDVQWGNTAHFALAPHGDELTGEMRGEPREAPAGKHPALLFVELKRN